MDNHCSDCHYYRTASVTINSIELGSTTVKENRCFAQPQTACRMPNDLSCTLFLKKGGEETTALGKLR
jgi:hypothetical protein